MKIRNCIYYKVKQSINFRHTIMKKVLLLLALLPILTTSCSKDDETTEQTFFVNVYTKWENNEEEISKNTALYIFPDENKNIDNGQSAISVTDDGVITYSDGSKSGKPVYATKFQSGVFNIENMPNGEYILWVTHMREYGGICYSSYKKISVNYDYRGKSEKKVFLITSQDRGLNIYQNW